MKISGKGHFSKCSEQHVQRPMGKKKHDKLEKLQVI